MPRVKILYYFLLVIKPYLAMLMTFRVEVRGQIIPSQKIIYGRRERQVACAPCFILG
jgi:hypothetical protein